MKQVFLLLAALAVMIVLGARYLPGIQLPQRSVENQAVLEQETEDLTVFPPRDGRQIPILLAGRQLQVEVVTSSESITRGLSGRSEIGSDGMLFVFKQRHTPSFWMKDMQFALDFIWIDGTTVVDITENVPAPRAGQADETLSTYRPNVPIDLVLEVSAGSVKEWGIAVGDEVVLQPN